MVIAEKDGQMERDYDYSAAVYASDLEAAETVSETPPGAIERLGAPNPKLENSRDL